jgi:hypothetical protein
VVKKLVSSGFRIAAVPVVGLTIDFQTGLNSGSEMSERRREPSREQSKRSH